ncbi:hypothetical protein C8J56DRAFT_908531 [Mycena floridula]|nr:hypothetical protein C8J56DRAFT_908531 [Mycena floridula]
MNDGSSVLLCMNCHLKLVTTTSTLDLSALGHSDNVDQASVLAVKAGADAELEKLDKELARIENILGMLKKSRNQVLQRRDRCRYLTSSMRRVPMETWTQILTLVCVADDEADIQNPAIQAASVCTQWRQILLASPAMWSSFIVDLREGHLTSRDFLDIHFERSESLPVSIYFIISSSTADLCPECVEIEEGDWTESPFLRPKLCALELIAYFRSNGTRTSELCWSHLRITSEDAPIASWLDAFSDTLGHPEFSRLESLELGCTQSEGGQRFNLDLFSRANNLRSLTLHGYSQGQLPNFSWTQLQTVELNGIYVHVILELFVGCPNIVNASISLEPSYGALATSCVAKNLKSLDIQDSERESGIKQLFSCFMTPELQSLTVGGDSWSAVDLLSFLEPSPPLRSLIIRGSSNVAEEDTWRKIFLAIPSIETLVFHDSSVKYSNITPEFLEQLTYMNDDEAALLPRLTKFSVCCDDSYVETLVGVMESRVHGKPRLEALHIHLEVMKDSGPHLELLKSQVESLRFSGMRVKISYLNSV